MLSLIIFRHAKSDWNTDSIGDHDRPLTQRGERAARTMGNFLSAIGKIPDLALTSPAKRAYDTLDLASRQGSWGCSIMTKPEIYENDIDHVIKLLHSFRKDPKSLLITGHEPTCSQIVSFFTGGSKIYFPTGTMAKIDFDLDSWVDIESGNGELRWLMPPKLLTRSGADFKP
tara:strand:+ start:290 stop:805 length:516 start_codon:yes stop_codon:yes gene_type:complete